MKKLGIAPIAKCLPNTRSIEQTDHLQLHGIAAVEVIVATVIRRCLVDNGHVGVFAALRGSAKGEAVSIAIESELRLAGSSTFGAGGSLR